MKIKEKLDQFVNGYLTNSKELSVSQLVEIGITSNQNYLKGTYFEMGAALSSEPILGPRNLFIGAYSYMNGGGYLRDGVFIGRYCSIGRRVAIAPGMHSLYGVSTHPSLHGSKCRVYTSEDKDTLGVSVKKKSYTIIGNDVWIGDGAVIMPGVNVGTGSVIGANAVVTKDVEPFSVYGGVPAKKIRNRLPEDISKKLLESEWWELPHETLKSLPLSNVFEFIEAIGSQSNKITNLYDTYTVVK